MKKTIASKYIFYYYFEIRARKEDQQFPHNRHQHIRGKHSE